MSLRNCVTPCRDGALTSPFVEREDIKLMGPQEIQKRLGFSRQWTAQLIQRKGFPEPIAELAIGNVWLAQDVEEWIERSRPEEPS